MRPGIIHVTHTDFASRAQAARLSTKLQTNTNALTSICKCCAEGGVWAEPSGNSVCFFYQCSPLSRLHPHKTLSFPSPLPSLRLPAPPPLPTPRSLPPHSPLPAPPP